MNINFLWSKGLYNRNKYMLNDTKKIESDNVIKNEITNAKKYIWIRNGTYNSNRTCDLDIFAKHIDLIKDPLILITSDGDRDVPSSYNENTIDKILNSDKIIKWLTQNYDKSIIHSKLDYYPIGLDLHTSRWLINNSARQKIDFIKKTRTENKNNNKIFCDAHLHATSNERNKMHSILKKNKNIVFLGSQVNYKEITKLYNSYQFVLSPRGGGLDCHRTWELFLLGCIVITRTSSLDELWIRHELPVVIIEEWDELNHNLENKLKDWLKNYKSLTETNHILNKYTNDYWLK